MEATSEILSLAKLYELPIVEVDKGILNTLCGNRPHQGFVLRCCGRDFEPMKRLPSPPLVAGAGKKEGPKLWLALDEVGWIDGGWTPLLPCSLYCREGVCIETVHTHNNTR